MILRKWQLSSLWSALWVVWIIGSGWVTCGTAFAPSGERTATTSPLWQTTTPTTTTTDRACFRRAFYPCLFSSVGGNGDGDPPPPGGEGADPMWDDFFREESDNMLKAREFMAENSLPISFDADERKDEIPEDVIATEFSSEIVGGEEEEQSGALVIQGQQQAEQEGMFPNSPTQEMLANNPYMAVVSKIAPSELISKFTQSAHPRVQNAVRSTILSLIGGLPKMAFDTTTITTGQRLASLMFQLQMTGYMFKNAEYRLSLQNSLGSTVGDDMGKLLLLGGDISTREDASSSYDTLQQPEEIDPLAGKIRGKVRVRYDVDAGSEGETPDEKEETNQTESDAGAGFETEVDAAAYMSELRTEVQKLRDELTITRKEKEDALRKDLLVYIRTLPEQELRSLTGTISQDVLVAMKGLVNAVMSGIGEGNIGPDTVTEQSGEAMAQLCMWQLVVGYNLRTLEVREEMKKSLLQPSASTDTEGTSDTGAFE